MQPEKDIKFSEKKVDESWKEQAAREVNAAMPVASSPKPQQTQTSKIFLNFVTSLGLQTMIHLGEIPNPETRTKEVNLQAAREIIDLLNHLKAKTEGNLSAEEKDFFDSVLPELQMKFAEKA